MLTLKGKYSTAIIHASEYEQEVIAQTIKMLNSPAITNPVIIMPDTHVGVGSVIGFTMQTSEKVIPNIIGVDIGCGMTAAEITLPQIPLAEIDARIRAAVPTGFNLRQGEFYPADKRFLALGKKVGCGEHVVSASIGTLGGGNHFIEIGEHDGKSFLIVHTGSRNLGLRVAKYHQEKASAKLSDRRKSLRVERDLEYLEGADVEEYLLDMFTAVQYAATNRETIVQQIAKVLGAPFKILGSSVHNYISDVDGIIRKGAISAHEGEFLIVPINRTFGTIIGRGRGNPDWNFSAPHGAGRLLSRSAAKKSYTQEDADALMGNVFSSYNPVDEADFAYKSPESIMGLVSQTMDVEFVIKPILNIKG